MSNDEHLSQPASIDSVSDTLEDHNGKNVIDVSIFIEVSDDIDVDNLPMSAIAKLMQRLAKKATQKLIGMLKNAKDQQDGTDIRRSGKGLSPDG